MNMDVSLSRADQSPFTISLPNPCTENNDNSISQESVQDDVIKKDLNERKVFFISQEGQSHEISYELVERWDRITKSVNWGGQETEMNQIKTLFRSKILATVINFIKNINNKNILPSSYLDIIYSPECSFENLMEDIYEIYRFGDEFCMSELKSHVIRFAFKFKLPDNFIEKYISNLENLKIIEQKCTFFLLLKEFFVQNNFKSISLLFDFYDKNFEIYEINELIRLFVLEYKPSSNELFIIIEKIINSRAKKASDIEKRIDIAIELLKYFPSLCNLADSETFRFFYLVLSIGQEVQSIAHFEALCDAVIKPISNLKNYLLNNVSILIDFKLNTTKAVFIVSNIFEVILKNFKKSHNCGEIISFIQHWLQRMEKLIVPRSTFNQFLNNVVEFFKIKLHRKLYFNPSVKTFELIAELKKKGGWSSLADFSIVKTRAYQYSKSSIKYFSKSVKKISIFSKPMLSFPANSFHRALNEFADKYPEDISLCSSFVEALFEHYKSEPNIAHERSAQELKTAFCRIKIKDI